MALRDVSAGQLALLIAIWSAAAQGVSGQGVTPFVLDYLHRESGGRTLLANRRLIADNAGLAAEVAVAYAALRA